jgi:acyl-CoA thioester hydrolase
LYRHSIRIIPRFRDMDAFGHINNACYLTYFEEARIKYMDELVHLDYRWSEKGIILANAEIDFIKPGHFKDVLDVHTRCIHLGTKSFTLEYKLIRTVEGNEELLAKGTSVLVMYDYKNNTTIPVPEEWKKMILDYEKIA